jgi:hypothetical protein
MMDECDKSRDVFEGAIRRITGTSWLDDAARMSLEAARAKFGNIPDVPSVRESPPIQVGKNCVYRQCEHCEHVMASAIGAQAIANDAHYCMRDNLVTLVRWTP